MRRAWWLPILLIAGCRHVDLTGRWRGALPLSSADDCEIRLLGGGRYEFGCAGPDSWEGYGTWRFEDGRLTLRYDLVLQRDRPIPRRPDPTVFEATPQGNTLVLKRAGRVVRWERRL
ncbi:MAG: hypothetical protein KIS66_03930 [Fimbriimonadaceae bacterium]|nr:hypothetical protein [Fimbriimonadaceae bacterium]